MTDRLVIVFTLDFSREITHRDLIRLHDLKRKKKSSGNKFSISNTSSSCIMLHLDG